MSYFAFRASNVVINKGIKRKWRRGMVAVHAMTFFFVGSKARTAFCRCSVAEDVNCAVMCRCGVPCVAVMLFPCIRAKQTG